MFPTFGPGVPPRFVPESTAIWLFVRTKALAVNCAFLLAFGEILMKSAPPVAAMSNMIGPAMFSTESAVEFPVTEMAPVLSVTLGARVAPPTPAGLLRFNVAA